MRAKRSVDSPTLSGATDFESFALLHPAENLKSRTAEIVRWDIDFFADTK
jgi:hypothetical protein